MTNFDTCTSERVPKGVLTISKRFSEAREFTTTDISIGAITIYLLFVLLYVLLREQVKPVSIYSLEIRQGSLSYSIRSL